MYQISNISGFISSLTSILGTIFYFFNPTVTIVCAILSILNSLIQVVFGDQNNLNTEIATIIIAAIVALFIKTSIFNFTCFAICAVDSLILIIGWIFMIFTYKKKILRRKKIGFYNKRFAERE